MSPAAVTAPSTDINTAVPDSARVWNYLLCGKDNYPLDREAADQFFEIFPGIVDVARTCRHFHARVVGHLADTGIAQFLDLGVGLPTVDNTHEVAERRISTAKTVYVDRDALVMAHALGLLTTGAPARVGYVKADLREVDLVLSNAEPILDFSQPVAVLLSCVARELGARCDHADPARQVLEQLVEALAPGSCIAVCDATDSHPAMAKAVQLYNEGGSVPWTLRTPDQFRALLTGLRADVEVLEPGVIPVTRWRPEHSEFDGPDVHAWGGVLRIPAP